MSFFLFLSIISTASAAAVISRAPPSFTHSKLELIKSNAIAVSKQSWELGTLTEALIEHDTPQLSVFGAQSVPASLADGLLLPTEAINILDTVLRKRPPHMKAFMANGAAADPASLGVADIVAGLTTGNSDYAEAAASQVDWLLHDVPRDRSKTLISHRQELFQAWSDYVSMVPPTLAYYATVRGGNEGAGLIDFAYHQVRGYRDLLRDPSTDLWMHIAKGKWNDTGLWLTGNGWAAHGALRVAQTISKSNYADNMKTQVNDLLGWVNEILTATWSRQEKSGLMKNYMDQDTFEDTAGTALIAAATYRYSVITGTHDHIPAAERAFAKLIDMTDSDGWLESPVDPENFHDKGSHSPEAQSFLLMLQAAAHVYYSN